MTEIPRNVFVPTYLCVQRATRLELWMAELYYFLTLGVLEMHLLCFLYTLTEIRRVVQGQAIVIGS